MENVKLNLLDFRRPQNCPRCFFFVTWISIAFAIVVPQHMTERSVFLKNVARRQNQRDISSKLTSCTAAFIGEYYEDPSRLLFLLSNVPQDVSDIAEPLMRVLHRGANVYTLNLETADVIDEYDISTNAVVLSESASALERSNFTFINFKRVCNFVIALTNPFADEESFLTEAGNLTRQMWLRAMYKLVILAPVGDSILYAGGLPVRIDKLYLPAEPALLGRCEREAGAARWRYFADKTARDPRVVNAAMFDNFPYAFFSGADSSRFRGIEGTMVEEIANSMNIELNRDVIEFNKTVNEELDFRLSEAIEDVVFGGLLYSLGYSDRQTEYMTSYGIVRIVWMVPMRDNVSLRGLIAPFGSKVWYGIICTLLVGGLVKLFLFRDISFLDIAALILGVATRHPRKTSSRIKFMSWTFFGFFLTQLYLGSLADQLISAADLQIESVKELANSGLQFGGTERFANLLETVDNTDSDEEKHVEQMILDNFITFNERDYHDQLLDLMEGKNDSLALLVMLNLTNVRRLESSLEHAHILKETVGSYPLALATWRDFPYLGDFNFRIQVLVQAGFVEFWKNMAASNGSYFMHHDEADDSNVELNDLAPAFLLLIMAYLGGFCLLIIEVIFFPSKILS